jgi:hypothetical protein
MFSNPLFQVWFESLEERRLRSAADVGPAPIEAPVGQGPGVALTVGHDARPLKKLADQAALGRDDDAFVTEWFIADDGSGAF